MIHLRVECDAGHRGEQTPRMLQIDERKVLVEEVIDAWLAPDHRYFKLRGDDGDTYIIRQDMATETWELTMFQRSVP